MTLISYNLHIPAASHNPSNDQPLMEVNNDAISQIIAVDHIGFNVNNSGLHQQIRMPVESLPTVAAGFGGLYVNTATSASPLTESDLFYTPDASTNIYQLTRTITGSFALFGTNTAYGTPPATFTQNGGWTFLPGGMLFQYGFFGKTGATGSSGTIQFPVTFTNVPYSIQVSLYRNSGNQQIVINSTIPATTSSFSFLTSSNGSDGIYWTAIGV